MLPPNFITSEGIPKLQNVGQKYLWECWIDFSDRVKKFDPDIIVANGDLIDGPQRKQHGAELSLPLLFDQTEATDTTLRVLKKKAPRAKWFFTQGTAYHVGHGAQHEENIAKSLGAVKYRALGPGVYCKQTLFLRTSGKILEFSHHASGAMSGPFNELKDGAIAQARGYPAVDLMVRNHLHYYKKTAVAYGELVNGPCWQLQTGYGRNTSTYKHLPDIGGLLITVGEHIDVRRELYELPAIEITEA
jgi:hypothetical protein